MWVWNSNQLVEPYVGFRPETSRSSTPQTGRTGPCWKACRSLPRPPACRPTRPRHHRRFPRRHGEVREVDDQSQLGRRSCRRPVEHGPVLLRSGHGRPRASRPMGRWAWLWAPTELAARPRRGFAQGVLRSPTAAQWRGPFRTARRLPSPGILPAAMKLGTKYYLEVSPECTAGLIWRSLGFHPQGIRGGGRLRELHRRRGQPDLLRPWIDGFSDKSSGTTSAIWTLRLRNARSSTAALIDAVCVQQRGRRSSAKPTASSHPPRTGPPTAAATFALWVRGTSRYVENNRVITMSGGGGIPGTTTDGTGTPLLQTQQQRVGHREGRESGEHERLGQGGRHDPSEPGPGVRVRPVRSTTGGEA